MSRSRRNKQEKAAAKSDSKPTASTNNVKQPKNRDDMTMWEIFTSHPLIYVGKFILLPYIFYLAYYFIPLQHPEYVSKATAGLINLRPAIHGTTTPRQLLILASQSSGTVQMTKELKEKLHLEIGHETVDAAWNYVRDGTISWFHGIRFLTQPTTKEGMLQSITGICNDDFLNVFNMGFHPAEYGPPKRNCSYRTKWDACWKKECFHILLDEWGCSINNTCDIQFAYNIHQVRNPLRTMESLVVKFCIGGLEGEVQPALLTYATALFPFHNFREDSCIEAAGYFLVFYNEAMIEARKRGKINSFYHIEETTACQVAEMAGLTSLETTVYEPNYHRIQRICGESDANHPAKQIVKQSLNKVNLDMVHLGWKDLRGGMHGSKRKNGDATLEKRVRNLFRALGYDESKELDVGVVPIKPSSVDTEL
ncbi:hypothetical protein HJC23_010403 [Cyclotella cryptica]|uniref:Sulfotransferase n=1 Tax=Cyclotella cryptica TaxID=29204 RepID=A0ABD3QII4_9STRA|eukprot:CCRYP_005257-RA/>CCRYP_005257-RA protein AED:0.00 eAED:0.00 QI:287/-1/1/1/-1/1/1/66/422